MVRRSRAATTQLAGKFGDTKARFSELVRRARGEGSQRSLTVFLQSLDLSGLDMTREHDTGRDSRPYRHDRVKPNQDGWRHRRR